MHETLPGEQPDPGREPQEPREPIVEESNHDSYKNQENLVTRTTEPREPKQLHTELIEL